MRSYFVYLSRHKLYTAINVASLGIAFAFCILVASFVIRQCYTDSEHENIESTYLVTSERGGWSSYWMHKHLLKNFGDRIESATSISRRTSDHFANNRETKQRILLVDSLYFDIFTYEINQGDIRQFRESSHCAVVSEEYAIEMYGEKEDPIGNRFIYNGVCYTIVATMKEPGNTVLDGNIIISAFDEMTRNENDIEGMHTLGDCITVVKLRENADAGELGRDITSFFKGKWAILDSGYIRELGLTNFREAYFGRGYGEILPQGNKRQLIFVTLLGLALAIFAGRMYAGLTVAQSSERSVEMAIRQLIGTSRGSVILRLFREALIFTVFCVVAGIIIAYVSEDAASELMDYRFEVFDEFRWWHYLCLIGFCLLISTLGTITPSVSIMKNKPIDIVKHTMKNDTSRSGKIVSSQYSICFILLIPTIAIWLQMNHLTKAPLGYNTEDLLVFELKSAERLDTLYKELKGLENVEEVGFCDGIPLHVQDRDIIKVGDEDVYFSKLRGDSAFLALMGIKMTERLGEESPNDRRREGNDFYTATYVNEAGAKLLGVTRENPTYVTHIGNITGHLTVKGIYSDFRCNSMLEESIYVSITNWGNDIEKTKSMKPGFMLIKTLGDHKSARTDIIMRYNEVYADRTDNVGDRAKYIDEHIKEAYTYERRILDISAIFTALCIITTLCGLYVSAWFIIDQKKKTIGIWRACGGTVWMIGRRMIMTYMGVMTGSFILALPIAYWLSEYWLERFAYRIDHPFMIYILVYFIGVAIVAAAVMQITYMTVRRNPAELMNNGKEQ